LITAHRGISKGFVNSFPCNQKCTDSCVRLFGNVCTDIVRPGSSIFFVIVIWEAQHVLWNILSCQNYLCQFAQNDSCGFLDSWWLRRGSRWSERPVQVGAVSQMKEEMLKWDSQRKIYEARFLNTSWKKTTQKVEFMYCHHVFWVKPC
jgi:hypothetical protein